MVTTSVFQQPERHTYQETYYTLGSPGPELKGLSPIKLQGVNLYYISF